MRPNFVTQSTCWRASWVLGGLIGFPALGVWLSGEAPANFLAFPPLTERVNVAPFSWPHFIFIAVMLLLTVGPFVARMICANRGLHHPASKIRTLPSWGWWGVAAMLVAWCAAWIPAEILAPVRRFTFTPLWVSYVVVISALSYRRQGYCMLTDRPRAMLRLTLGSAAFWWYFEMLNRIVKNWAYEGVAGMPPWQYVVFATAPFATVLPAVVATYELLTTYPALVSGLRRFMPLRLGRAGWILGGTVSVLGLVCLPLWPEWLFPALWLAPMGWLSAGLACGRRDSLLGDAAVGDWRRLVLLALAALICGFMWEMWNSLSLARWIYQVPFVQRFQLFEMPLLGYAGYLPFGWECGVAALLLGVKLPAPPRDKTNAASRCFLFRDTSKENSDVD